ncbi:MAG: DoxX family protein [Nanoarchaeota archaeon]
MPKLSMPKSNAPQTKTDKQMRTFQKRTFQKPPQNPFLALRILMGVIFLSAGMYRLFNYAAGIKELTALNFPAFSIAPLTALLIIFEIACGLMLLFNRYVKIVLSALVLFLAVAIGTALASNGAAIILQAGELFVFNANATDVMLHIVFLVILVVLLMQYWKDEKKRKKKAISSTRK